jgi:syntaxin 16
MAERMTEEREKAITKVAESVNDLAEIFKEIQVLVIDQGTILDRIDYNIEQAADRVVAARGEIEKANDYQKKSRTMMCIYLLLVMCGFMVCILIVKKMALGA